MKEMLSALLFTLCSQLAHAQLATPNGSGITYGQLHLNVSNIEHHIGIWTEHFGGEEISIGHESAIKFPNMIVMFTRKHFSASIRQATMAPRRHNIYKKKNKE